LTVGLKLNPELEAKVLALAGEAGATARPKRPRKQALIKPLFLAPATFLVPVVTVSEANHDGGRKAAIGRKASQRVAVSKVLGPRLRALAPFAEAYHAGKPIRVLLTRFAPRKLDRSNLWRALKACEDVVATMLGADDGDKRWLVECDQLENPAMGLRIELRFAE
jgi:hypothetical protein